MSALINPVNRDKLDALADVFKSTAPLVSSDLKAKKEFMEQFGEMFQATLDPEAESLTGPQARQRLVDSIYRKIKLLIARASQNSVQCEYGFEIGNQKLIEQVIERIQADKFTVTQLHNQKVILIEW